jgi:hypothetical protein
MSKKHLGETRYYTDELNDDFSGLTRNAPIIDETYTYIHKNVFYRFFTLLLYRMFLEPWCYLYTKIVFHQKIVNRGVLKPYKKSGYFLYANHTQIFGDGIIPSFVAYPKRVYVVVSPENLALKGTRTFMTMAGALPVPSTIRSTGAFLEAMKYRLDRKGAIMIYPEAHVWPNYTGIRDFKPVSFKYPVKWDLPSFCFTNCYRRRRFGNKPRIVTYVDGPFFADSSLPKEQQHIELRQRIYETMKERSVLSDYVTIHYVKASRENSK